MAALTIFDLELAAAQGRITPRNYAPRALLPAFSPGAYQFVLGSDVPGRRWRAAAGDYAEVAQSADWAANILRVAYQVRPPAGPADGTIWRVEFSVDGTVWDTFTLGPGDPPHTRDSVGVRGAAIGPTPHTLALRLVLAAAGTVAVAQAAPHPNPQVVLTVAGASNPAVPLPIVLETTTPHGLADGDVVFIAGVLGNIIANGYWPVTVVDASRFSLDGSHAAWAPSTRFPLNAYCASAGNYYRATAIAGLGRTNDSPGGGPSGPGPVIDNPGPNQVTWTLVGAQTAQNYSGGPGTVTAPPNAAVTSSTALPAEVELPGVYAVCFAEDNA